METKTSSSTRVYSVCQRVKMIKKERFTDRVREELAGWKQCRLSRHPWEVSFIFSLYFWKNLIGVLEKEMATHSSILAWRIPWTEELGGLQSTGRKESDTTERLQFLSLYWSVVDLQCWVSFRCTAKWIRHTHTHTLFFRSFSHIDNYRVLSRVPCAIH